MEQDGNEHSAGLVSTFTKEEQRTCCKKWTTCLLSPTTIFQSEASQNILGQYLMHCSANIIHQYGTCEAGNHILGYLSGSSHQYLLFTCVAFAWRCNFTAIFVFKTSHMRYFLLKSCTCENCYSFHEWWKNWFHRERKLISGKNEHSMRQLIFVL